MDHRVLILPGLNGSGPEHWQTLWELKHPGFKRITASDWARPICRQWIDSLENEVALLGPDVILVAHSLGCLQVVHWASETRRSIKAAFLVAPPNPERPDFPSDKALGFAPVPKVKLSFLSILVASTNDPFASIKYAEDCASHWGSEFINIGNAGHINADSNLGYWPMGFELLKRLIKRKID